ncbi:hypothetical protein CNEO4_860003 [Clostridium neonatale]|nr:hypothetical protein CNEO4_860003 [Clostridium neonatale]
MSDREQALVIASIDIRVKSEKEKQDEIEKKAKRGK